MGGKCSKYCKKFPCNKKRQTDNNEIISNNPSSLNKNNESIIISHKITKTTITNNSNNSEKSPIKKKNKKFNSQIIISPKRNCIYSYFSEKDMIKINKLLEEEKNQNFENIKIRHFKLGNLIGQGSYGKVYEALDEERGQLIAVKILDKTRLNNINNSITKIESEIEILSKLHHKNIVKYYGSSQSKNHLQIYFEYCENGSIEKMLKNYKNFPEKIIQKYTKEMLEGLEYLHAHGIIHRDIKGGNILVDRNGICKLSDFGVSKKIKDDLDKSNSYSIKGTPNYMAPEIVKNNDVITRFSDIWSLGCTVIEMINGKPPWSNIKNPFNVLFKIANSKSPPDIPKNCSFNLRDFISCCLKINPYERLNVTQLLKHPFITGNLTKEVKNDSVFFSEFDDNNVSSDMEKIVILQKKKSGESDDNNNRNSHRMSSDFNDEKKSDISDNDIMEYRK